MTPDRMDTFPAIDQHDLAAAGRRRPQRLVVRLADAVMFGASYTFGERGVISVDYERDWYNGIRIKDNPSGLDSQSWYNIRSARISRLRTSVRVGAEFKPLRVLSLRAGFVTAVLDGRDGFRRHRPSSSRLTCYGAGVGFVLSRGVLLDLAYQYVSSKLSDYYLFYAEDKVGYTERPLFDRHQPSQRGADARIR